MKVVQMNVGSLGALVGAASARELFRRYFVIPFFVAEQLCLNEPLREVLGLEKTLAISRRFGGSYIQIQG